MNDGGPAFPFTPNQQMQLADGTWDQSVEFGDPGMSLRDWLAGMALASKYVALDEPCVVAHQAYDVADAMLKHRADTGETHEATGQESEPAGAPGSE